MIKSLVSVRFRSLFAQLFGVKRKDGSGGVSRTRIVVMSLAYLYVAVVLGAGISYFAYIMSAQLVPAGLDWFYFAPFVCVALSIVFMLSIFETKAHLFECKDNELLLAMPIKPSHIVLSRVLTVLIMNYIETVFVMLPVIICYIIAGGEVLGIVGSILVTLLLPLLSTALSSGAGYLVALFTKKTKNNALITTAISLVFLGLYFWGYSALMGSMNSDEALDFVALSESLTGIRFAGQACMLEPLSFTVVAALSIGLALLAYFLISRSYASIVTSTSPSRRTAYKHRSLRSGNQLFAIIKKELCTFVSSSAYMLNAGIGLLFTVAASVALLINSEETIAVIVGVTNGFGIDLSSGICAVAAGAITVVGSMTLISASSISLEGKRFWILRSLPVSASSYLMAKAVSAFVISAPFALVSSVITAIAVGATPLEGVLMSLSILVSFAAVSLIGLVVNAFLPKLDFESEIQVIKQSAACLVSMVCCLALGIAVFAVAMLVTHYLASTLLALSLMIALSVIVSAVCVYIIAVPMARKFDNYAA